MIFGMNAEQIAAIRDADPVELGLRIKTVRLAKGLTQSALAGGDVSVGMISRIEAGQRRVQPATFERFAERLGVPVRQLLSGAAPDDQEELRLELDYAELALESGQAEEARTRAATILASAPDEGSFESVRGRARYLHALALESLGEVDDAIIDLEALTDQLADGVLRISAGIALSRCYRESGDLARAIETAERQLRLLSGGPLESSDEAVQLTATLAAAHFERGDTGQAVRVIRRAVAKAEGLDSPMARAAAYWNASILEAERGGVADAVALAERALGLLREGETGRNLARLQAELGILQLRLDPPEISEARRNLEQAAEQYVWANAAPADLARNDLALARAHLLAGEVDEALKLTEMIVATVDSSLPILAGEAYSIHGQAQLLAGNQDDAVRSYRLAIGVLTGLGDDRAAAQLWFELADMLDEVGEHDAARSAYRSAAAATGLRSTAPIRVAVPS